MPEAQLKALWQNNDFSRDSLQTFSGRGRGAGPTIEFGPSPKSLKSIDFTPSEKGESINE